jgi:NAD(P)-dependent dehydrogenase (short-subunit alcohol dehydrogenase family)/pimeloyl-ACP methyl ester carboxylesterase
MTAHTTVTSTDGLPLAVYQDGDPASERTIMLVHGYPDTHQVWDQVTAALAAGGWRVVRYDVRGAGQSGRPSGKAGYRIDQLAADLFAVADAVSPDRPVHLAGHDWGSVQAWQAVTCNDAADRIASFTSISGPSLDHSAYWYRDRMARPTPRHLAQALGQWARSWYITAFHLPGVVPLARLLRLPADAVDGIGLYLANIRPRMRDPEPRVARVPVQVITLTRDAYLSPSLVAEDLDRWAPDLTRRTLRARHWAALKEEGTTVARMIRDFAAGEGGGPVVVVTGAGSGIGRATALAFARRGATVVGCDVDLDAARDTAAQASAIGPDAFAYCVDVSDEAAMASFAAQVSDAHGIPRVVVNNAGIGHAGTFLATTAQEWRKVLDVNLWGVIHGCRAFGSLMVSQGIKGHIVNVASAAAYLPSRDLCAYATSKAAVVALSDSLRGSLAGTGIGVSVICPGIVNTNITRTTTFSGLSDKEQADRRDRASRLYARRGHSPEKVAEAIVQAVKYGRTMVPVTPEARVMRAVSRFAPALARAAIRRPLG